MKKISVVIIATLMVFSLVACGSSSTVVEDDHFTLNESSIASTFKEVCEENSDLSSLKLTKGSTDNNTTIYLLNNDDTGEALGGYMVMTSDGYVNSIITSIFIGSSESDERAALIAIFMTMDSNLTYKKAESIADKLIKNFENTDYSETENNKIYYAFLAESGAQKMYYNAAYSQN